jgi:hypothetical protein
MASQLPITLDHRLGDPDHPRQDGGDGRRQSPGWAARGAPPLPGPGGTIVTGQHHGQEA